MDYPINIMRLQSDQWSQAMKLFKILSFLSLLLLSSLIWGKDEDLGENFYFEDVKETERGIASDPKVVKPQLEAVEPTSEHEEDNDRSVASDVEQEPSNKGVKFWKFEP